MPAHRSTSINYALRYCPHATVLWEAGTPAEVGFFQTGIAAHAILQEIGEAQTRHPDATRAEVSAATVRQLVTNGRAFDGRAEPPMSPDHALAGERIALGYLATHDLPADACYEAGLAVDRNWQPVAYDDPSAWWRAILDVHYPIEEAGEDYALTGRATQDYKSAWSTGSAETMTIQLKGQARVLLAHYPDVDFIRREAVNLRTGATYRETTMLDDAGRAEVKAWEREIELAVAYTETKAAKPGACCAGCPFVLRCEHAARYWRGVRPEHGAAFGPEALARTFAVVEAAWDELAKLVKIGCDGGEIKVDGGTVGYRATETREPSDTSAEALAAAWFGIDTSPNTDTWSTWRAQNERLLGLLKAAKIGATGVDAIGKILHPYVRGDGGVYKESRAALEAAALTTKVAPKFGVTKTPPAAKADVDAASVIDAPPETE